MGQREPSVWRCSEAMPGCTNGSNPHADGGQQYALGTYFFYLNENGRNSIDNAGMNIISSVHYGLNYDNAFWNGAQMIYAR